MKARPRSDTAYWDCLFIAAMYLEKQGPPPDTDTGESTLRTHLEKVIGEVRKAQAAVEAALHEISAFEANPAKSAVGVLKQKVEEAKDTAQEG